MRLVPIGAHLRILPASQWRLFFPSGHLTLYLPIPAVLCLLVVSGSWFSKRPLPRSQPGHVTVQLPHLLDVLEKVRMTLPPLPLPPGFGRRSERPCVSVLGDKQHGTDATYGRASEGAAVRILATSSSSCRMHPRQPSLWRGDRAGNWHALPASFVPRHRPPATTDIASLYFSSLIGRQHELCHLCWCC